MFIALSLLIVAVLAFVLGRMSKEPLVLALQAERRDLYNQNDRSKERILFADARAERVIAENTELWLKVREAGEFNGDLLADRDQVEAQLGEVRAGLSTAEATIRAFKSRSHKRKTW